jgi:hypothetical protein
MLGSDEDPAASLRVAGRLLAEASGVHERLQMIAAGTGAIWGPFWGGGSVIVRS